MRYLSLLVVITLMGWTWSVAKRPNVLPENTHLVIQEDLRRVITEHILEAVPSAKSLQFDKFWTETLKENQIKASFTYSFEESGTSADSTARVGVSGFAILNRSKDEDSDYDVWNLDDIKFTDNSLVYKEGTIIKPSEGGHN